MSAITSSGGEPRTDPLIDVGRLRAVASVLPAADADTSELDDLVDDASRATGAPICALNLVLNDAVLVIASQGIEDGWMAEAQGLPAEWAACSAVVRLQEPLIIGDVHADPAQACNPVAATYGVRSYAGFPLHAGGRLVGTLCVLDRRPHAFSAADLQALAPLARRAERLLDPEAH